MNKYEILDEVVKEILANPWPVSCTTDRDFRDKIMWNDIETIRNFKEKLKKRT